jgi:preprotein translocase SecE subunit
VAASDQPKQKRRLRAPAETVREKAVKAQEAASAPTKGGAWRSFWRGVFWPIRMLGRGLAWLSHQPPLKQIGHGLRWFFSLRFMRFLGKILGISYVASSWKELKLVTWPNAKQSRQLTGAVIIFSIVFGALIAVVDYGLDKLFKQVILKG